MEKIRVGDIVELNGTDHIVESNGSYYSLRPATRKFKDLDELNDHLIFTLENILSDQNPRQSTETELTSSNSFTNEFRMWLREENQF